MCAPDELLSTLFDLFNEISHIPTNTQTLLFWHQNTTWSVLCKTAPNLNKFMTLTMSTASLVLICRLTIDIKAVTSRNIESTLNTSRCMMSVQNVTFSLIHVHKIMFVYHFSSNKCSIVCATFQITLLLTLYIVSIFIL